ncbi:hypothetical protein [Serratia rubidaea]|uniref:Pesticin C-terminal domain-containing protein n=1 Tax=Serratia rubidaea TaxID=61652 RepID=A0A3S4X1M3_SERRU|nr:hypothetical protein [Serratia rubidaea]MBH1928903.1 hypothetical protein [Serratia rubidaea]MDC6118679.1 hypothetical protein [Serratia rubidaea]MEB7587133.1 hypothetical protein [Serratia rubidaea]VEI69177.1 Uncharacterised protein [Serratia rubidaea]
MSKPTVERGKFTYDSEGNDSGKWNSRYLHWPEKYSGVTIGRGYDLKHRQREQVIRDLTGAGISQEKAELIAGGVKLTRDAARNFVRTHRERVGEITIGQQILLFNRVYAEYERVAKRVYQRHAVSESGYIPWDKLSSATREIITDMVYHGAANIKTYRSAARDNKEELITHIRNNINGDLARHNARINYLRNDK